MNRYDWNAGEYAKHSKAQQAWARELIAKLHLQGPQNVLDIGCGDGKVTAEIAKAIPNGSVLGIDNSRSMIELAQKEYSADRHRNLRFQLSDARALPFNQEFEIVFSNAALHWIRDHKPVLDGIYKSLRPGGRILLQMGGRGNAAAILAVLDDLIGSTRWAAYFKDFDFPYGFHDAPDYEIWLNRVGFDQIRAELIPKDMIHGGRPELGGWIRTTWLPYTQRIPEKQQEEFINDLVDKYTLQYPLDDKGKIFVQMVRLEVAAAKTG
ncbi:MAG: methyltransferase domain-containing protein [bacterium]|nr:methyltransferase domain-containing protein [bacterium]